MPPAAQDHRMDNAQLIRAAQQGNAAAFEQLVQQYDRAVLRLTIHLTGSQEDGQDMYQEAFLSLHKFATVSLRVLVLYMDVSHCHQSLP